MRRLGVFAAVGVAALAPGCATGIVDKQPTYVTDLGATINGAVLATDGGGVSYWVEYGRTTAYGKESAHRSVDLGQDRRFDVSVPIDGLSGGTTWHYRLCAADAQAGTCSKDRTLRTSGGRSGIAFTAYDGDFEISVIDADGGNITNLTDADSADSWPTWAPDAGRIAFASDRDSQVTPPLKDIWVMDADGGNPTRLTSFPGGDTPAWSPDGTKIAFVRPGPGRSDVWVMDADGQNQTKLTSNGAGDFAGPPAWSPDGTRIAFSRMLPNTDVWVMDADGGNEENLTQDAASYDFSPAWSPDGRTIAFMRNSEIYAMDPDGAHPRPLAPTCFVGGRPAWSPEGGRIAFANSCEPMGLYVMDADGGNRTEFGPYGEHPAWSPRP